MIITMAVALAALIAPTPADDSVRVETMADAVNHCATVGDYYGTKDCVLDAYKVWKNDGTLPLCEFEDSTNCLWLSLPGAASFIDVDGFAYYLPPIVHKLEA